MKHLLTAAAFALCAPGLALAASSYAYVPELTGAYTVGGVDPTWKVIHDVELPWQAGSFPSFLTYELSGVLRDPVVLDPASHAGEPGLGEINFNGAITAFWQPSPSVPYLDEMGLGWGTSLNSDVDWEIGEAYFHKDYDASTGRFYFGATIAVATQCEERMMGGTCPLFETGVTGARAVVSAIFYNYKNSFVEVTLSDPGFVFVESVRIGLSDQPLGSGTPPLETLVDHRSVVPEPGVVWMWGIGLLALVGVGASRSGRRRGTMQCHQG